MSSKSKQIIKGNTSEELKESEKYSPVRNKFFRIGLVFLLVLILLSVYFTLNQFVAFIQYFKYIGKFSLSLKPIICTSFIILIYLISVFTIKKAIKNPSDEYEKRNKFKLEYLKKIITACVTLSISLLLIYSVMYFDLVPRDYEENTEEEVKRIAIHESAHCLVNEIFNPGTTIELRIFNSKDKTKAHRYLYSKKSQKLPAGIHISTREYVFKKDFYNDIQVSLAGLIAQKLISDEKEATYGAESDIKSVEKSIIALVNNGLTELGPINWNVLTSEEKRNIYNKIVDPLYEDTKKIILKNKGKILRLSEILEKKEILSGSKVREILNLNNTGQK